MALKEMAPKPNSIVSGYTYMCIHTICPFRNHKDVTCMACRVTDNLTVRSLFRTSKTSKICITNRLCGNPPPATGGFPTQRSSNAEVVSMPWRHHGWRESHYSMPQDTPVSLCEGSDFNPWMTGYFFPSKVIYNIWCVQINATLFMKFLRNNRFWVCIVDGDGLLLQCQCFSSTILTHTVLITPPRVSVVVCVWVFIEWTFPFLLSLPSARRHGSFTEVCDWFSLHGNGFYFSLITI